MRSVDPPQLLRTRMDMNEGGLRLGDLEKRVALGGDLTEAPADQHQEVGLLHAANELRIRREAEIAGIVRMQGVKQP